MEVEQYVEKMMLVQLHPHRMTSYVLDCIYYQHSSHQNYEPN